VKLAAFVVGVAVLEAGVFLARIGRDATPFALVLIPTAVAIAVAGAADGWDGVKRLVGRLGRWQVGWRWYAAAIGIPMLGYIGVALAAAMLGEFSMERLTDTLTISAILIPLVVLLPALLEELGWRGFAAQTAVDGGHSPAWAALVLGGAHMLVHVPLYLPGHLYDALPLWPLPLMLLGYGVLLTWIYLRTGGSVLLAGLMHAALNAWVPLTWALDPEWAWMARGVVFALLAVVVVLLSGVGWWREGPRPVMATPSLDASPRRTEVIP
jgi:membrane protease YdiL (CAAX protease family)